MNGPFVSKRRNHFIVAGVEKRARARNDLPHTKRPINVKAIFYEDYEMKGVRPAVVTRRKE